MSFSIIETNRRNFNPEKIPTQVRLPSNFTFDSIFVKDLVVTQSLTGTFDSYFNNEATFNNDVKLPNIQPLTGPNGGPNVGIDPITGILKSTPGSTTYVDKVNNSPYDAQIDPMYFSNYIGISKENWTVSYGPAVADGSLPPNTNIDNNLKAIEVFSDNTIAVGGQFNNFGSTPSYYLAFINNDGTLNQAFDPGFDGMLRVLKIQVVNGEEKLLVGGSFSTFNSNSYNYLVRLNRDGTVDTTFNIGSGFNGDVYSIALQGDQILVGGTFTNYDGNAVNRIVRLNIDGSIDATFASNIGSGANNRVQYINLLSTGKILINGQFTNFDGNAVGRIARLNSDGTYDATFVQGTGFSSWVIYTAELSTGDIIVGGQFSSYDGNTCEYIAKLDANGAFNSSFTNSFGTSQGFDNYVNTILVTAGDQIVVGGWFEYISSNLNYKLTNYLCRLNSDGTLDTSFESYGLNDMVYVLKLDNQGKILVGGNFNEYYNMDYYYLVRIGNGIVAGWELVEQTKTISYYVTISLDAFGISTAFQEEINIGNENNDYIQLSSFPVVSSGNLNIFSNNNLVTNLIVQPTSVTVGGVVYPIGAQNLFNTFGGLIIPPAVWNTPNLGFAFTVVCKLGN